jgi:hypothetical protein
MQGASFCNEGLQVEVRNVENIFYVFCEFCRFAFELNDVLHLLNEKHRNYNYKSASAVWTAWSPRGLNYIGYNKSLEWSSPFEPASQSTGSSRSQPSSVHMQARRLLPLYDLDCRRRLILYRSTLLLPKINQNILAGAPHSSQHFLLLCPGGLSRLRRSVGLFDALRQSKIGALIHEINKECINSIIPYIYYLRSILLLPTPQRWWYCCSNLDDLSRRYINLLPFWFLTSTIAYLLGAWF